MKDWDRGSRGRGISILITDSHCCMAENESFSNLKKVRKRRLRKDVTVISSFWSEGGYESVKGESREGQNNANCLINLGSNSAPIVNVSNFNDFAALSIMNSSKTLLRFLNPF